MTWRVYIHQTSSWKFGFRKVIHFNSFINSNWKCMAGSHLPFCCNYIPKCCLSGITQSLGKDWLKHYLNIAHYLSRFYNPVHMGFLYLHAITLCFLSKRTMSSYHVIKNLLLLWHSLEVRHHLKTMITLIYLCEINKLRFLNKNKIIHRSRTHNYFSIYHAF